METSLSSIVTRGRFLFLTIAIVLWVLPTVHAQTFEWAALMGGPQTDRAFRIASDASNSVYVVGWFRDQAHFGSKVITSAGDYDIFFAKYRTDGMLNWVMRMGGPGPETGDGFGVDSDGAGNVCITGNFTQTADFAGVSLTSYGGRDIFVACFSDTGTLKWIHQAGGPGSFTTGSWTDYGTDVVIARDGAVYVTGEFRGTAKFDGLSVTSRGYSDAFLAKYLPNGSIAWVRRLGGSAGTDDGYGLAIDSNGDVILTGCFSGSADIGPFTLNSKGGWEIYVSKWSPNGSVIWAKRAGGAANDRGVSVTTDSNGNVYVTGYFKQTADFGPQTLTATGERDGFVTRMQSDGTFDWTVPIHGEGTSHGHEIRYASHGRIYVSGGFAGEGVFGTIPADTGGDRDAFLASLDPSGTFDWFRMAGSDYDDWGYGITLQGPRVLFSGQVQQNPTFGSLKPVGYGSQDGFLASIDLRPQPPTLISPAQDAAYISTSPSLVWSSVDLATRYDVQVASDVAFANIVYTENTSATHVVFTAPVAEHDYYWRVHGVGLVGPGEWSEVRHFTVGKSGPLAPQLTSPADNISGVGTSPTLTWLAAPEADWHRIQVAGSQAFVSPEISVDNVMGTRYQATGLGFDTRYFWRVAGVSESGNSTWSAPWSFVTMPATLAAPSLVSPAQDASDLTTSPDLVWSPVEHATRYNVQVASDEAFEHLVYTENTPETQVTFVAPVAGHDYYWRVQGIGPVGDGPWSEIRRFSVGISGPLAPQLTAPADNVSGVGTSPTLAWIAAPEADWHRIQVASSQAFVSPEISVDNLTGTSYQASGLAYATHYFWRVAGVSESGKSTWSAPWLFVTMISPPGEVILLTPESGAEGVPAYASFDWQGIEGVDKYHLQVKLGPPWSSTLILAVDDSTLTVSQYTMTAPLHYATSYQWRVRAHNESGFGPWCPAASFVVAVGTAVEDPDEIPTEYYLAEPYPNPFNPSTRIEFGLPEAADVTVGVFDATGRLTAVLAEGHRPAGRHVVTWDAGRVGSGVYFVRMEAGNESRTRTVIATR